MQKTAVVSPVAMKRLIDVVLSAVLLVVLMPALLIIAALVASTSPGRVLFRQKRVGYLGADFTLLKFRSMTGREGASAGSFDAGDSTRVTPIGRILRRTKLDELPQLWNVLTGDMSLVGPRPEVRKWVDAYASKWAYIHGVKPGITDPASIVYRDEEELLAESQDPEECYRTEVLPRKLQLYEDYVRNQSIWLDFTIMARTAVAVFMRRRER